MKKDKVKYFKAPKKEWIAILQTRDGFIKVMNIERPTPFIGINWWMPGMVSMTFKMMTMDSVQKQAFYLMDGRR